METVIWTMVFILVFCAYAWIEKKSDVFKLKKINEKLNLVDYKEKLEHGMIALTGQSNNEITAEVSLEEALLYTDSTVADFLIKALNVKCNAETLDAIDELLEVINSKEFKDATKKSFSLKSLKQTSYYPQIKITYPDSLGKQKEFRSFELNYTLLKKIRKEIAKNIEF